MKQVVKVLLVVAGLISWQAVLADDQVEAKYRQSVMKSIGGHMASMANILKNQVHTENLATHARGIAALSEIAPTVFPAGSGVDKSKALDAVWDNPEDFAAAMDRFTGAATDMSVAAETGEMSQIGPAIQALGGACKGCHDDFKEE